MYIHDMVVQQYIPRVFFFGEFICISYEIESARKGVCNYYIYNSEGTILRA